MGGQAVYMIEERNQVAVRARSRQSSLLRTCTQFKAHASARIATVLCSVLVHNADLIQRENLQVRTRLQRLRVKRRKHWVSYDAAFHTLFTSV
jgi:hypothetical protein